MKISIICPTYNEEKYISSCIDSILGQDYPREKMEVFIIDGKSTDGTVEIIKEYRELYTFVSLITNPLRSVPHAMNLGIERATGDYIIRLDAHAYYPPNYFSKLISAAVQHNTDNIGGLCVTEVQNVNPKSTAIKTILSHKFGVGNSDFRTGVSEPKLVDTVPFGCFKKDVFTRFGLYDERLIRNQDIELNKRIINGGGKILLMPSISCTYFARETKRELSKNNYNNGLWNILTIYYTRNLKALSIRHFIPLLFVLSILFPILLAFIFYQFVWLAALSLVFYFSVVTLISLSIARETKQNISHLVPTFFFLHTSYGVGSMAGIFKILKLNFSKTNEV